MDSAHQNINELIDYKIEGEILYVELLLEKEYDVDEAELLINFLINYTKGKRYKLLVNAGSAASISLEGLKLIKHERTLAYAYARAYVITSFHQVIMARFYLRINKPVIPTNYFKTIADAEKWLETITLD